MKAFLVFFYRYSAGLTIESSSHMVLRIVNITVKKAGREKMSHHFVNRHGDGPGDKVVQ